MLTNYESMVIIQPLVNDEEAGKENEKFLTFIKEKGGEIIKTDVWGRRKLAYEIKKQKEGYYFVNYYKVDAAAIKEIDRYIKLDEKILRANILHKED